MLLYPGKEASIKNGVFKTDEYKINDTLSNEVTRITHEGMMGFVSVLKENLVLDEKRTITLDNNIGKKILEMIGIYTK